MQGCAFLEFVDTVPHLGVKSSKTQIFWQICQILKLSYYQKYCINRNQILHSDKDKEVLFVDGPNTPPIEQTKGWIESDIWWIW